MKRRDFLKLLGFAGAAMSTSCIETYHWMGTKPRKVFSYLNPPEEGVVPGESIYFTGTCTECPAHCGTKVRVREGKPVKLEGNDQHPVNRGALCMRGQASLERMYHPNRLQWPMAKNAQGGFNEISWDEAYTRIKSVLAENKEKKNVYLSGRTTGTLAQAINFFSEKTGVARLPEFEPLSHAALRQAYRMLFGKNEIPFHNVEKSDFLLTVGADVLETYLNPVSFGAQFGDVRKKNADWTWLHVEPHLSITGLKADKRFALEPQSEVYLLRFLVGKLASGFKNSSDLAGNIPAITVDEASAKTGISKENLEKMASSLAKAKSPLLVIGGVSLAHQTGLEAALLAGMLQWGMGMVGETVDFSRGHDYSSVGSMTDMEKLNAQLKNKEVGVIILARTNPVDYMLPAFGENLNQASLRVGMGYFMDNTLNKCDIVLPLSHEVETLGDADTHKGMTSFLQPVVKMSLYNTRSEGDIILELTKAVTQDAGIASFEEFFYARWAKTVTSETTREALKKALFEKGYLDHVKTETVEVRANDVTEFLKTANMNPKTLNKPVLVVTPSLRTYDGRSANLNLLEEIPDPLSTISYGAWVSVAEGSQLTDRAEVEVPGLNMKLGVRVLPVLSNGIHMTQQPQAYGRLGYDERCGQAIAYVEGAQLKATGGTVALAILSGSMYGAVDKHGNSDLDKRKLLPPHDDHHAPAHQDVKHRDEGQPGKEDQHRDDHGHGDSGHGHGAHAGHLAAHKGPKSMYPAEMYDEKTHKEYRWAMAIDLDTCTGCSACVAACYVENNVAIVGKEEHLKGRESSWIRMEPYVVKDGEQKNLEFMVMLCQHCSNAPCESVCPVFATYHNPEGLNAQIYNRCVGTRYCSNNCPYKVRRFNWFDIGYKTRHLPLYEAWNPDVSIRNSGVMEKCTFCIQRIRGAKDRARDEGRKVKDGEVVPACAQTCSTDSIVFGNILDQESRVYKIAKKSDRKSHRALEELGTETAIYYLGKKGMTNEQRS